MQYFFVVVLVLLLGFFIFFQVRGFVRDIKKRKEAKKVSAQKIEEAEKKQSETYEQ